MSDSQRRRSSDGDGYSLNDRVSELAEQLQRHITDCTAESRKLFWAVVAVLGWLMIHSLPFFDKMVP